MEMPDHYRNDYDSLKRGIAKTLDRNGGSAYVTVGEFGVCDRFHLQKIARELGCTVTPPADPLLDDNFLLTRY